MIDEEGAMRMQQTAATLAFCLSLTGLLNGCDEEPTQTDRPVDAGTTAEAPPSGFTLNWSREQDASARGVLEKCHRLTDRQLASIWMERQDEPNYADLAPYWGGPSSFEGDAERAKADETYRERAFEELEDIRDLPWCVEFDVVLGDYDFDAQSFAVEEVLGSAPDETISGRKAVERIEIESGSQAPPFYEHQLLLGLRARLASVSIRQGDARPILEERKSEDEAGDAPAFAEQLAHLTKLHPAALRAVFAADDPEEEKAEEPDAFAQLEKRLEMMRERPVKLVAAVDPVGGWGSQIDLGGSKVELKGLVFDTTHAAFTIDGRVVDARGSSAETVAASMPPWQRYSHDDVLEAACGGSLRWSRQRVLSGGAIVEKVEPYCRKCPEFTSSAGSYERYGLEGIGIGNFDLLGGGEAIVWGMGCYASRADGEGQLAAMRRNTAGDWYVSDHTDGIHDCELVGTADTAAALVCAQYYTGGGGAAEGNVSLVDITPNGELRYRQLFRIQDSWTGACAEDEPFVWSQKFERDDEGRVTIQMAAGTPGPDAECGEEFAGDVYQVVVEADASEVGVAEESQAAVASIKALTGGN